MPGIKTFNGQRLILRPTPYAPSNFGIDTSSFTGTAVIPRPRFLFYVRFVRAFDTPLNQTHKRLNSKEDGIAFQIKTMDLPKFKIQTEKMNQYNKVRIVQTKIEYDSMTIDAHDDIGDKMLGFWNDYYAFYYGQGRKQDALDWQDDIVRGEFNEGRGSGWGYTGQFGQTGGSQAMHYLQSIEIIRFYGKMFNIISFVHPFISSFDHDGNDYSESREGSAMRIQFDYEGVIYSLGEQNINDPQWEQLRDQLGFRSDYFDPDDANALNIRADERKPGYVDDLTGGIGTNFQTGNKKVSDDQLQSESFFDYVNDSVLSGIYDFGSNAYKNVSNSLSGLTDALGLTASGDLVAKETGVKNKMDLFGNDRAKDVNTKMSTMTSAGNRGLDSRKINEAAAAFSTNSARYEQSLGDGMSTVSGQRGVGQNFSRTFGSAAALAKSQGLVGSISSNETAITQSSSGADAIINKLPTGDYRLTSTGASVMNTLRDSTSSIGSRTKSNPFENPDNIDSGKRTLAALTGGMFGNK